ncbi:MAG TPA: protein kinase [Polyangia bacterium]|nr:protein kinase [Polyangia bacterium]
MSGERTAPGALPDEFGRYRILRTLAFGGMAQILLAEDVRVHQPVVIKRILPHYAANPEFVQFFIHEGRLGQRLRHPNLVETLEAGQVGESCYIALEYLRGQPAIELLRQAARAKVELPLGAAVRIVADAARGLHHAHIAVDNEGQPLNVVHRDVTPHNLFLCVDGTTKVLDFGIAKAASQLHQTRTGTIKGKFAYLAPEQIRGESIDRRVDVFALGIVLYELLTLRPLFRGANDAETLNRVLTLDIPPPELVRPGVPPGLGAVALRALQRDRERRLPSAEALADSIEAVAEAEGIDASARAVAELLAELCPSDEPVPQTPSQGSAQLNAPDTGSRPALTATAVTSAGPPSMVIAVEDESGPIIELRHPKAVPALQLTELDAGRERQRQRAARAAIGVVGMGVLLLTATQLGTCVGRATHGKTAAHASPTAIEHTAVPAPANAPRPQGQSVARRQAANESSLVPAAVGASAANDAVLRVQLEGQPTFVVDGRTERAGIDGALHLSPGHHRVIVSAATLAFPRTLEVDLMPRELQTRTVTRGRGHLHVAVTPWAEVTIDGKVVGTTPLAPIELGEGAHAVALKNGDLGVVAKRKLVISPDKETLLKLDLFGEKK